MTALKIARGLALPLEAAGQTTAVLGIRGSGKTNSAGVICEETLDAGLPILVIDPTDSWWGLKQGYEVLIFGGEHGDLPLDEHQGQAIAEFLVAERVPVIVSLAHLRKGAQRRVVTEMLEALYQVKAKPEHRHPLLVLIDEAPLLVPQMIPTRSEWLSRSVGAIEDLVERGRSRGFGVVLVSQRAATINKNVLTQAETLLIHRLTSPQDRKALGEWVQANASPEQLNEVLRSLAALPNGAAWVWSPRLDVFKMATVRLRRTFDSSASPGLGKQLQPPKDLKAVDLSKWQDRFAAAIEQRKENDPAVLKKRIAELERLLATATEDIRKAEPERVEVRVEIPVLPDWLIPEYQDALSDLRAAGVRLNSINDKLLQERTTSNVPEQRVRKTTNTLVPDSSGPPQRGVSVPPPARSGSATAVQASNGEVKITGAHRRVLRAVAMRMPQPSTRNQAAVIAGYRPDTGHFYNLLSFCTSRGLLEKDGGGALRLTREGCEALGSDMPDRVATHEDVMALWRSNLSGRHFEVLQHVARSRGEGLRQEQLAERMGLRADTGHFYNLISRLNAIGLIRRESGVLSPAEELWP